MKIHKQLLNTTFLSTPARRGPFGNLKVHAPIFLMLQMEVRRKRAAREAELLAKLATTASILQTDMATFEHRFVATSEHARKVLVEGGMPARNFVVQAMNAEDEMRKLQRDARANI